MIWKKIGRRQQQINADNGQSILAAFEGRKFAYIWIVFGKHGSPIKQGEAATMQSAKLTGLKAFAEIQRNI